MPRWSEIPGYARSIEHFIIIRIPNNKTTATNTAYNYFHETSEATFVQTESKSRFSFTDFETKAKTYYFLRFIAKGNETYHAIDPKAWGFSVRTSSANSKAGIQYLLINSHKAAIFPLIKKPDDTPFSLESHIKDPSAWYPNRHPIRPNDWLQGLDTNITNYFPSNATLISPTELPSQAAQTEKTTTNHTQTKHNQNCNLATNSNTNTIKTESTDRSDSPPVVIFEKNKNTRKNNTPQPTQTQNTNTMSTQSESQTETRTNTNKTSTNTAKTDLTNLKELLAKLSKETLSELISEIDQSRPSTSRTDNTQRDSNRLRSEPTLTSILTNNENVWTYGKLLSDFDALEHSIIKNREEMDAMRPPIIPRGCTVQTPSPHILTERLARDMNAVMMKCAMDLSQMLIDAQQKELDSLKMRLSDLEMAGNFSTSEKEAAIEMRNKKRAFLPRFRDLPQNNEDLKFFIPPIPGTRQCRFIANRNPAQLHSTGPNRTPGRPFWNDNEGRDFRRTPNRHRARSRSRSQHRYNQSSTEESPNELEPRHRRHYTPRKVRFDSDDNSNEPERTYYKPRYRTFERSYREPSYSDRWSKN